MESSGGRARIAEAKTMVPRDRTDAGRHSGGVVELRHGGKEGLSNGRNPPRPGAKSPEQGRPYDPSRIAQTDCCGYVLSLPTRVTVSAVDVAARRYKVRVIVRREFMGQQGGLFCIRTQRVKNNMTLVGGDRR